MRVAALFDLASSSANKITTTKDLPVGVERRVE
jgi:hypothetical protein